MTTRCTESPDGCMDPGRTPKCSDCAKFPVLPDQSVEGVDVPYGFHDAPCCDECPMVPTCDEMAAMSVEERESILSGEVEE